jgi:hypothetical protein
MSALGLSRVTPLAGVAFVALAAVTVALDGDDPGDGATTGQLLSYWSDRADTALLGAFLAIAGVVCLLTFAASLRGALRSGEPSEASSSAVAFAGAIVAAAGLLVSAMLALATSNAAEDGLGSAVSTLDQVASESWLPMTGGFAAMALAAGIGGLRSATLPRSLCWAGIALGVGFVTPAGIVAFLALPLWIIAASVVLYRSSPSVATANSDASTSHSTGALSSV